MDSVRFVDGIHDTRGVDGSVGDAAPRKERPVLGLVGVRLGLPVGARGSVDLVGVDPGPPR